MPDAVRQLRPAAGTTVRAAADAFLDSIRSPNTNRAYAIAVVKVAERLDGHNPATRLLHPSRALAEVIDDEIGDALETQWGSAAVNTWNARPRRHQFLTGLVPRTRARHPGHPVMGQARDPTRLRHSRPHPHRDRPAHRLVRLWQVGAGTEVMALAGRVRVHSCVFSPDGSLLATTDVDTTRLMHIPTGRQQVLTGHTGRVNRCAFSADGALLVTAGNDATARVWRVADGSQRAILPVIPTVSDPRTTAPEPGQSSLSSPAGM